MTQSDQLFLAQPQCQLLVLPFSRYPLRLSSLHPTFETSPLMPPIQNLMMPYLNHWFTLLASVETSPYLVHWNYHGTPFSYAKTVPITSHDLLESISLDAYALPHLSKS